MKHWFFWLAVGCGLAACTPQPMMVDDEDTTDDGEDDAEDDAEDDGAEDDDEGFKSPDAGKKLDAGKRDASAGKRDAGKRDAGPIEVICEEDGGTRTVEPKGGIGASCAADDDCEAGGKCLTEVALPFGGIQLTYPGGYCTKPCAEDAECGDEASCPLAAASAFAADLSTCMLRCETVDDCRDGYSCGTVPSFGGMAPTSTQKSCLPPSPLGGTALP